MILFLLIIIAVMYLFIGFMFAGFEAMASCSDIFAYYDVVKILFWLPLVFFPRIDKRLMKAEILQKPVFK